MKLSHLALVVVLSAVTAFVVGTYVSPTAQTVQAKETAYERVMRTGTLRCGYVFYPEFLARDVNTGIMSGFYYDLLEEIGHRLNIKIEWTEEVGMATAFEGLKTNRYDSICSNFSATPGRARVAEFTEPVLYSPYYAYVRAADTRFDQDLSKINDPSIKVVVLDGELSQTVKAEDFPKAATLSLPNGAEVSQTFLSVEMGKADMTMAEPQAAQTYMDKNPGKIKRAGTAPLRTQIVGLNVAVGEEALKALLNTTIESLHSTGFIERLFIKTPADKEMYFLPAQPWRRAGE